MKTLKGLICGLLPALLLSCAGNNKQGEFCKDNLNHAEKQITLLLEDAQKADRIPRTITAEGEMHYTRDGFDWTEGFFPGTCWYMYEFSGKESWKNAAEKFQEKYVEHRLMPFYHDLGFVFNCSYGHGFRMTGDERQKEILIDASNTLIGRFNPVVGCIMSWDVDKGWQSKRGWKFPVIIDNMMNLEMLFEASQITGDPKYKNVAINHANTTMKNHFREDNSSYHVIDYDPETGEVRNRHTAQGYAHESAWARGQGWGLYGYTMCYRYTKDPAYLKKAKEVAAFYFSHPNLPEDLVPYWDFNAPKIPNEPRDASAAALIASGLIELAQYTGDADYMTKAKAILISLASDNYTAPIGENHCFVLKHSVGSIPHNNEIDVPLNYADYYYIEALLRMQKVEKGEKLFAYIDQQSSESVISSKDQKEIAVNEK